MIDLRLVMDAGDEYYGDIYLGDDLDIGYIADETDPEGMLIQRLTVGCNLHRGEWPLDIEEGVPWIDAMGKNVSRFFFVAELSDYVSKLYAVAAVENMDFSISEGRKKDISFTVVSTQGQIVNGEIGE